MIAILEDRKFCVACNYAFDVVPPKRAYKARKRCWDIDEVVRMIEQGVAGTTIIRKTGICRDQLVRLRKKRGLVFRRRQIPKSERDAIVRDLQKGMSMRMLVGRYDHPRRTLQAIANELRGRQRRPKRPWRPFVPIPGQGRQESATPEAAMFLLWQVSSRRLSWDTTADG